MSAIAELSGASRWTLAAEWRSKPLAPILSVALLSVTLVAHRQVRHTRYCRATRPWKTPKLIGRWESSGYQLPNGVSHVEVGWTRDHGERHRRL